MGLRDLPQPLYADEATMVSAWRSVVFTVGGFKPITVKGAREQCRACEVHAHKVGPRRLGEIVLLDPEVPMPEKEIRDVLDANVDRMAPYYACVATLYPAQGFRASVIRGVLTSLQLLSRTQFAQKVFSEVDPCVAFVAAKLTEADPHVSHSFTELFEALEHVRRDALARGILST